MDKLTKKLLEEQKRLQEIEDKTEEKLFGMAYRIIKAID